MSTEQSLPNTVATRSKASQSMLEDIDLARALLGGTKAMRAMGTRYLPKWPNEEEESYKTRLGVATLFPAFKRTVITLAAKPFSKPMTFSEDMPESIKSIVEDDVDQQGRNLHAFASDLFVEAMGPGLAGILVEFPVRPEGAETLQAEKELKLRPYFVAIYGEQILGWKTQTQGAETKLTQLRLMMSVEEDDGPFATKTVDEVRVLEPGKWTTYRKASGTGTWVQHQNGEVTIKDCIPFVPITGERCGFMHSKPPLLELAHLNVKHWQSQSDQDTILHVARVPILTVKGVQTSFTFTVGAASAINLGDNRDAEMKFVEHTGAAIDAGKASIGDLKDDMRQSGAELLVMRPKATTATEIASDNAVGQCMLQELAEAFEDALDEALEYMAEFLNEQTGGNVTLFKDFGANSLAEATAALLIGMATAGKLSDETLFKEMQRRGAISGDVDWEEEKSRIEAQGPSASELAAMSQTPPGNKGKVAQ